MSFKLREYQQDLYDRVRAAWETFNAVLLVLATGGGKTVIFSMLARDHVGAAAIVAHRKEIEGQISIALARLGVYHRVVAPPAVVSAIRAKHLRILGKCFIDPHAKIGAVSVQTVTSRGAAKNAELQRWLDQVTLAIFDEGHHYVSSGLWGRAVDRLKRAALLFVTATPERADGKGLGAHADGYAETMIEGPSAAWLIEQGYLTPFIYRAPSTDLDVVDVPLTAAGAINTQKMRARITESHLVGDVVEHYLRFGEGKQAILFANDVATAHEHAAAFVRAGVKAVALDGTTDPRERDREVDGFASKSGATLLANVDLFDEGFDVSGATVAVLSRVTESLAKFLQMIGRVLRPEYAPGFNLATQAGRLAAIAASDKPYAIVIDPVRNWERHGMPNWPRRWTLDRREKASRGTSTDTVPQRVCLGCSQPYEAFFAACPYCKTVWVPAGRSAPAQVAGDLFELDVEGMLAMFAQIEGANMSAEDYALEQVSRNLPPVARPADLRRHKTVLYRREVLDQLVKWWLGMQPAGRPLGEKHKRFYFRFGVDIGTAFALSAADTDALIDQIAENFGKDIAA